jgi:excisionase family DNA binding protein
MSPAKNFRLIRPHLIQVREAGLILGVSVVTIRRRVRSGALPHVRIAGRLYFRPDELHRYIEAHRGDLLF